ncbi:MAG TPA: hypothetical protein VGW78_07085 [Candidatus Babeliales bacterium]|jgi:hypothetical protein|nr:hypothetical protein [Candidatus Babeliales bacterium]
MKMKQQLIIAGLLSNSLWAMNPSGEIHLTHVIKDAGIEVSSQLLQLDTHNPIVTAFNNSLVQSPNKTLTEYAYADKCIKQLNTTYDLHLHIADYYAPVNNKPCDGAIILRGLNALTKICKCKKSPVREGIPHLTINELKALHNLPPTVLNKTNIPKDPVTCMVQMSTMERYSCAAKQLSLGNKFIAGFGIGFIGSAGILAKTAQESHMPLTQIATSPEILKTTVLCGLSAGCMHVVYTLTFGQGAKIRKEWLPQEFKEKTIDFTKLRNEQL